MHTWLESGLMGRVIRSSATLSSKKFWRCAAAMALMMAILALVFPTASHALAPASAPAVQQPSESAAKSVPAPSGGEANLRLPDMKGVSFLDNRISGYSLLERSEERRVGKECRSR